MPSRTRVSWSVRTAGSRTGVVACSSATCSRVAADERRGREARAASPAGARAASTTGDASGRTWGSATPGALMLDNDRDRSLPSPVRVSEHEPPPRGGPSMITTMHRRAGRREWLGLAVLALPCVVYAMDLTVLNLALPALSEDLRPSSAQLLWIVDIYGFLVAGLLITMGTLGDRIGRRRLLLIG